MGPQTDAVLREAEELRLRRESRSSDAGNEGGTRVAEPAQEGSGIPLEALTGLGASLVPFGRRVPHQDVTAACRRLYVPLCVFLNSMQIIPDDHGRVFILVIGFPPPASDVYRLHRVPTPFVASSGPFKWTCSAKTPRLPSKPTPAPWK